MNERARYFHSHFVWKQQEHASKQQQLNIHIISASHSDYVRCVHTSRPMSSCAILQYNANLKTPSIATNQQQQALLGSQLFNPSIAACTKAASFLKQQWKTWF
mmetsp:Transcript_13064/g.17111  ORF Transcript_13064/g.17111 Transcript_13064/m.17111 type:complete len:103 (+) Transcript_13064:135-443(+)